MIKEILEAEVIKLRIERAARAELVLNKDFQLEVRVLDKRIELLVVEIEKIK